MCAWLAATAHIWAAKSLPRTPPFPTSEPFAVSSPATLPRALSLEKQLGVTHGHCKPPLARQWVSPAAVDPWQHVCDGRPEKTIISGGWEERFWRRGKFGEFQKGERRSLTLTELLEVSGSPEPLSQLTAFAGEQAFFVSLNYFSMQSGFCLRKEENYLPAKRSRRRSINK